MGYCRSKRLLLQLFCAKDNNAYEIAVLICNDLFPFNISYQFFFSFRDIP